MARFEKGNKIGHRFTADNQPPAYKKKPKLHAIPADAREKVFAALYYALTLPDKTAAQAAMDKLAEDLPECGYLIQVYARGLMGKNGADVADKILDRLFGKPKQTTENILSGQDGAPLQIVVGSTDAMEGLKHAIATGAQPREPEND